LKWTPRRLRRFRQPRFPSAPRRSETVRLVPPASATNASPESKSWLISPRYVVVRNVLDPNIWKNAMAAKVRVRPVSQPPRGPEGSS
jgi:hypothetical protein